MDHPAQQPMYVNPQGNAPYQGQIFYNATPMVQVSAVTARPRVVQGYKHRQSMGLGVTQIIIGVICFACNSVLIGYNQTGWPYIGHGMWCGIMLVISGSFGIAAAKTKTYCMIVTFMVMSIIAAISSGTLLVLSITGAVMAAGYGYYGYEDVLTTEVVLESCMALFAFVNGALTILWCSTICCKDTDCCTNTGPTNGVIVSGQQVPINTVQYNGAPQMMYVAQQSQQGQFTQYPGVPMYNGYAYPNYGPQFQEMSVVPPPYMPSTNIPPPQGGYATTAPLASNGGQVNLIVSAADPNKSYRHH